MVWREGLAEWQQYQQVMATFGVDAGEIATCCQCRRTLPTEEMISYQNEWVCANCKDDFFQRIRETGSAAVVGLNYGGFWIRFGAKFIDGIILWVVNRAIQMLLGAIMFAIASDGARIAVTVLMVLMQYAIAIGYVTFFIGKFAATPGKMACGLKVIVSNGSRVGYWRAFGRYFAEILSVIILLIGYIMVAFDKEKRALHDHICNTRVIRK